MNKLNYGLWRLWVMCLILPFISSAGVMAQTSTGQITVTVVDQTEGLIPGATVTIIEAAKGNLVRTLVTNDQGVATALLLKPDTYNLEVEMPGFQKLIREGLVLRVGDVMNLRVTIEPGVVTQSVTVVGETPLLEEKTHDLGQVVDEVTILNLPLNGRNYLLLGNLTAGTVPNTRSRDKTFSAFGNRGWQNAFLLDGARNQNYLRGLDNRQRDAMRPSLEALSEFKVQTGNFSAEYGAAAGAIVNVVTKSGSNEFHGSVFEFHRNSELDAKDFFAAPGGEKPLLIRHQFGGSLGGPVVTNRAWWFAAFERTHISEETTLTGTVPTPEWKQGKFGNTQIFNPFTTRPNPDGNGFIRDPFPNNEIPPSLVDPVAKSVIERYPDPMFATKARNFVRSPLEATRINNATFRGDVQVTEKDNMYARWSFNLADFNKEPPLPPPANTPVVRENDAWSVGYGYTRTFSPHVVNEFRFGWNRVGIDQDGTLERDEIVPGALAPDVTSSIPNFNVTGFTRIGLQPRGFGNIPLLKSSGVWNLSNNMSVMRGNHTLKFGFDYMALRMKTSATLAGRGSFNFTGFFSQDPQKRPGTGSPVTDLLLGLPHFVQTGTRAIASERAHNFYWYFQDDWTVTPNFTVNLGVRYELTRPFWELDNRMANFILEQDDPRFGQLILAGDPEKGRTLIETDKNNIAPRIGFAYRGPAGLVIRAGYGIFYGQDEGTGVFRRMTNNPPFFGFGGVGHTSDRLFPASSLKLSEGLPSRPAPIDPQDFVLEPKSTARLRSWEQRHTIPYVQQWSLGVQKQLRGNILWETTYVGNHGLSLWASYEGNQPLPGPGSVNNRRPLWPQYTRARIIRSEDWASSTYHGIATRFERRFSQGLSFLLAYTLGRSIDTASNMGNCDACAGSGDAGAIQDSRNLAAHRGPSIHHMPHRFVFSGIWRLPFGKGQSYVSSGAWSEILGGWRVTGIVTLSDGIPFTPRLAFNSANTGTTTRPNRLRDGKLDNPTVDRYFDVDAFEFPPPFTFGNSGRGILEGPGTANVDFALHRIFGVPISEEGQLEFRFEAFNLFNRPHFSLPGDRIGTRTAGVIGSTSLPNRQLQFGLKLVF